jgi:hypothetical protein
MAVLHCGVAEWLQALHCSMLHGLLVKAEISADGGSNSCVQYCVYREFHRERLSF